MSKKSRNDAQSGRAPLLLVVPTLFSESSDERAERVKVHGLANNLTEARATRARLRIFKRCRGYQRGWYRATVFGWQAAYSA